MRQVNCFLYGIFGTAGILFGLLSLIHPGGSSFHEVHLAREQGAAGVFIGLMSFWCAFNYERRRSLHYALTVLALLLAAIHWWDYLGGHLRLISPLYNSLPLVVLLCMFGSLRDGESPHAPAMAREEPS